MTSELDRQMASPMGRSTMSEPISDAELARIKQYGVSFGLKLYRHEADALFARLAAAEAERDAAIADYVAALAAADDAYRVALRNLTNDSGNYAALRVGVVYDAARNVARASMLADRAAAIAEQETLR